MSHGFNAYLLRVAPKWYSMKGVLSILKEMVRMVSFPPEFFEWECVLALKKEEDPSLVHWRRDLWMVPHAQKLVAHVVGETYDEAVREAVPSSQGGWEGDL